MSCSLLIAGSRSLFPTLGEIDLAVAEMRVDWHWGYVEEVVSGCAPGVDRAGEAWARARGYKLRQCPARWDELGKIAGKVRNGEMAAIATAAIVFWDGVSNGAADMVTRMVAREKAVHVVEMQPARVRPQMELLP